MIRQYANHRVILGIDPGLASVGYAFLKNISDELHILDCGVIKTSPEQSFSDRLNVISEDLMALLFQYRPTDAYVEQLFFGINRKTALDVAHARGVLISVLSRYGISSRFITPNQIKLAITGAGNADKKQVQKMLMLTFPNFTFPESDDAIDALAIAYTGYLSCKFGNL